VGRAADGKARFRSVYSAGDRRLWEGGRGRPDSGLPPSSGRTFSLVTGFLVVCVSPWAVAQEQAGDRPVDEAPAPASDSGTVQEPPETTPSAVPGPSATRPAVADLTVALPRSYTELHFRAPDGAERQHLSLRVDSGRRTARVELCTDMPCAVRLRNGQHAFAVGGPGREFTVQAEGGVQEWFVESDNADTIAVGMLLTLL